MRHTPYYRNLEKLLIFSHGKKISPKDRIVILSDIHMGDGGRRDDFKQNREIFQTFLSQYYLSKGYHLILNGDIEDLQKFSLESVRKEYRPIYTLFNQFQEKKRLTRIVGNHDYEYNLKHHESYDRQVLQGLKLEYNDQILLIFHGHQASNYYHLIYFISKFFLRYFFSPLGIKNTPTGYYSMKRYRIEKRVYDFSNDQNILSIIGHTHRPLFESLSKVDDLKFKIENLCRKYPSANQKEKKMIEDDIGQFKLELENAFKNNRKWSLRSSLYNAHMVIPCVFNSGCGIGKRGITAIEIYNNDISLIHWFDKQRSERYFKYYDYYPERLNQSDFYRTVLKQESLDYIFARIKLL